MKLIKNNIMIIYLLIPSLVAISIYPSEVKYTINLLYYLRFILSISLFLALIMWNEIKKYRREENLLIDQIII